MKTHTKTQWLVVVVTLMVGGAAAAQPAPEPPDDTEKVKKDEAKQRFKQGVALAKAGDCAAALAELQASFNLIPRAVTLYNMGQCNEELGRYAEAVAVYERYLALVGANDPDRKVVEAQLTSMRRLLGTLVIESNVEAEVWLGDRKVGNAPGELLVSAGRHGIELRKDGYVPVRREVELAGGQRVSISFTLEQAKVEVNVTRVQRSRGLPRYLFWSGAVATSGALIVGAVFGASARSLDNDTKALDPRLPRDAAIDTIDSRKTIADTLFIAAGVLAVATTSAYFLTDWGHKTSVAPTANQDTVGLAVWGQF